MKHLGKKEPVRIATLLKRIPEKETGYDKNLGKKYWSFEWSDGTKGEGSLYQSQIESVLKRMPLADEIPEIKTRGVEGAVKHFEGWIKETEQTLERLNKQLEDIPKSARGKQYLRDRIAYEKHSIEYAKDKLNRIEKTFFSKGKHLNWDPLSKEYRTALSAKYAQEAEEEKFKKEHLK